MVWLTRPQQNQTPSLEVRPRLQHPCRTLLLPLEGSGTSDPTHLWPEKIKCYHMYVGIIENWWFLHFLKNSHSIFIGSMKIPVGVGSVNLGYWSGYRKNSGTWEKVASLRKPMVHYHVPFHLHYSNSVKRDVHQWTSKNVCKYNLWFLMTLKLNTGFQQLMIKL